MVSIERPWPALNAQAGALWHSTLVLGTGCWGAVLLVSMSWLPGAITSSFEL